MVKVNNAVGSCDNSAAVSSCANSTVNGYPHQDKHPRLMSSFAKPSTSCVHNEFNSVQTTSNRNFEDCDGINKSNFFDRFPKKDAIMYAKSPPISPEKQHHTSFAVNGMCKVKYSPGSPKWTEIPRSRTSYSSPEQSPLKNFDPDAALFNISKRKAQPILYRKMFGVFKENHEVLARWSDGLYYLGTVSQVADFQHRCFVQFEDKSKCWVHFKDLQPINKDSDEETSHHEAESDVLCAICRDGKSEKPNEIVLCDKCGQGYHQLCHVPAIDTMILNEEDETWQCRTCVFAAGAKKGGAENEGPTAANLKHMKEELPYDITSLTWDKGHKSNTEETYCYCGGPGDWYLNMLQCCRCLQWFHEACLQCLEYPVLYGDRFFLFVCSICNNGNEFLKRLPMRWVDVVHLVLYNITITKTNKYYDFTSSIIPYFAQNWESLRLGDLVHEASTRSQLKDRVMETLQNNKSRFQSGTESKKAKPSWGLKTRSPPTPPTVTVPATGVINEKLLQSIDLRHGSMLLNDSPTPLKRSGPGDWDKLLDTPSRKIYCHDSYTLHKADNNEEGMVLNSASDNLFERFYGNIDPNKTGENVERVVVVQQKRKRGRPRKEHSSAFKTPLPSISVSGQPLLPSVSGGKTKKKDVAKAKKKEPTYASENSVIPITELFRDVPGTNTSQPVTGNDAYDEDLRRNMARYFGAEGRIALGERFNVLAKRVLNDFGSETSKVEYLIEWEGYTAAQLHENVQKR